MKEIIVDGFKYKNKREFAKAYNISKDTVNRYLNGGAVGRIMLLEGYKYGARLEWIDRRCFRSLILCIPIKDDDVVDKIKEIVVNNEKVVKSKIYVYNHTIRKKEAQIFMLLRSVDIQIPLNLYSQIRELINHQAE